MRALILVECCVVLALAGLILVRPGQAGTGDTPEVFPASQMIVDALPGERAIYRVTGDRGTLGTLEFTVFSRAGGAAGEPPRVTVTRTLRDRTGQEIAAGEPTYVHSMTEHFLFPFQTPSDPRAFDRVWVWKRIRRDEIPWHGRPLPCWRVDCIDPGLDPEHEAVSVWMHPDVPVYGILKWTRDGIEYECTSWRPK